MINSNISSPSSIPRIKGLSYLSDNETIRYIAGPYKGDIKVFCILKLVFILNHKLND